MIDALYQKAKPYLEATLARLYRGLTPSADLSTLTPILVLGNQKTGSTAIARLLAAWGRLSATTDIHPLQAPDAHLPNDPASVEDFIQRMRYYFRRDLVKENALTPATDALLTVLPAAQPVYVVRHPVQNIRSILDRVGLPGDPRPLDALDRPEDGWSPILDNRHLDLDADDHVTALAQRWSYTTAIYRRHQDRLTLVRYEDFVADKLETIRDLANQLGIDSRQDIRPLLDVPFQPRGSHRSVDPTTFFSDDALAIINRECSEGMSALDYEPIVAASS